ncbi:MAG: hypothetical protein H6909_03090 [Rickettsiaceae bacterium]|nr:hypothetical protein [Rickettsiaceae bacterium]
MADEKQDTKPLSDDDKLKLAEEVVENMKQILDNQLNSGHNLNLAQKELLDNINKLQGNDSQKIQFTDAQQVKTFEEKIPDEIKNSSLYGVGDLNGVNKKLNILSKQFEAVKDNSVNELKIWQEAFSREMSKKEGDIISDVAFSLEDDNEQQIAQPNLTHTEKLLSLNEQLKDTQKKLEQVVVESQQLGQDQQFMLNNMSQEFNQNYITLLAESINSKQTQKSNYDKALFRELGTEYKREWSPEEKLWKFVSQVNHEEGKQQQAVNQLGSYKTELDNTIQEYSGETGLKKYKDVKNTQYWAVNRDLASKSKNRYVNNQTKLKEELQKTIQGNINSRSLKNSTKESKPIQDLVIANLNAASRALNKNNFDEVKEKLGFVLNAVSPEGQEPKLPAYKGSKEYLYLVGCLSKLEQILEITQKIEYKQEIIKTAQDEIAKNDGQIAIERDEFLKHLNKEAAVIDELYQTQKQLLNERYKGQHTSREIISAQNTESFQDKEYNAEEQVPTTNTKVNRLKTKVVTALSPAAKKAKELGNSVKNKVNQVKYELSGLKDAITKDNKGNKRNWGEIIAKEKNNIKRKVKTFFRKS